MDWSLEDAEKQFPRLVQTALTEGPQMVTVSGERAAVVLSAADYDALRISRPTLVEALLSPPAWDDALADTVADRARMPGPR